MEGRERGARRAQGCPLGVVPGSHSPRSPALSRLALTQLPVSWAGQAPSPRLPSLTWGPPWSCSPTPTPKAGAALVLEAGPGPCRAPGFPSSARAHHPSPLSLVDSPARLSCSTPASPSAQTSSCRGCQAAHPEVGAQRLLLPRPPPSGPRSVFGAPQPRGPPSAKGRA